MDRRTFLGTMTAATVLANRFAWATGEHKIEHLGVQLYTVRDAMKQDFEGSLAKVAAVGYKEVEFAGFAQDAGGKVTYFDRSPQDARATLDRHGLTAASTHVGYKSLSPENFPRVIEASRILGSKYVVNPSIDDAVRNGPDGWKRAAETFNRAGEASKKAGIQFAYHNHWIEYDPTADGKLPYDILLDSSDPSLVKMEMDLCWITVAGADPLKYFARYPGRFPLVHVKDMKRIPRERPITDAVVSPPMTEVGSGMIDWKRIFAHSEQAGIKHYFVENDFPKDPFESIQVSYEYLEKLRF